MSRERLKIGSLAALTSILAVSLVHAGTIETDLANDSTKKGLALVGVVGQTRWCVVQTPVSQA